MCYLSKKRETCLIDHKRLISTARKPKKWHQFGMLWQVVQVICAASLILKVSCTIQIIETVVRYLNCFAHILDLRQHGQRLVSFCWKRVWLTFILLITLWGGLGPVSTVAHGEHLSPDYRLGIVWHRLDPSAVLDRRLSTIVLLRSFLFRASLSCWNTRNRSSRPCFHRQILARTCHLRLIGVPKTLRYRLRSSWWCLIKFAAPQSVWRVCSPRSWVVTGLGSTELVLHSFAFFENDNRRLH